MAALEQDTRVRGFPARIGLVQLIRGGIKRDTLWEILCIASVIFIIIILPLWIYSYDRSLAASNPGRVFNIIAKNELGSPGRWLVQKGLRWDYRSNGAPNTITVREGETVTLRLTGEGVIHEFSLPKYGIKKKVYPGKVTTITFKADKIGEFKFECINFCGEGHEQMTGKLIVVPNPGKSL